MQARAPAWRAAMVMPRLKKGGRTGAPEHDSMRAHAHRKRRGSLQRQGVTRPLSTCAQVIQRSRIERERELAQPFWSLVSHARDADEMDRVVGAGAESSVAV